jgi:hypothetical protein
MGLNAFAGVSLFASFDSISWRERAARSRPWSLMPPPVPLGGTAREHRKIPTGVAAMQASRRIGNRQYQHLNYLNYLNSYP